MSYLTALKALESRAVRQVARAAGKEPLRVEAIKAHPTDQETEMEPVVQVAVTTN
jgi:enoyl-[acyl-carrier-protein] reductase (NADH)